MFQKYQRIGTIEARPYEHGDQANHVISISEADMKLPTLVGGMVARNPDNHGDMWYIAADFFAKHYAPAVETTTGPTPTEMKEFDQYIADVSERRISEVEVRCSLCNSPMPTPPPDVRSCCEAGAEFDRNGFEVNRKTAL